MTDGSLWRAFLNYRSFGPTVRNTQCVMEQIVIIKTQWFKKWYNEFLALIIRCTKLSRDFGVQSISFRDGSKAKALDSISIFEKNNGSYPT